MKRFTRMESIGPALRSVLSRINDAAEKRPSDLPSVQPRLLAVSKTKSVEFILEAYRNGQRHFGENYVQEIVQKANDPEIKDLTDIKWHFIGHLQRNKCNNLLSIPNLYRIESVDSKKLATALNNSWGKKIGMEPLSVLIQVNTSNEESKTGCPTEESLGLVEHVLHSCPHLQFAGLMTIGGVGYDWELGPNPDFMWLFSCRETVCERYGLGVEDVELSMGMSSDFEQAIHMGSTSVRVGSTIFGAREPKPPQSITGSSSSSSSSSSTMHQVLTAK